MTDDIELIKRLYERFNARDIEALLSSMAEDVMWANGMDGGYVHGRQGVRSYWTRQWTMIDPRVDPINISIGAGGEIAVDVHQVVRGLDGQLLGDKTVGHTFEMEGGLVKRFDIRGASLAENELPCLDLLAATPGILRGLMCEVSEEDARWKPAHDRFSIAEVLAHLSQSDGHCRTRVERFMTEQRPALEPDDAQFHLDLYCNADPASEFERFKDQRETIVEFLRTLAGSDGRRVALHLAAGEITLAQMLHEWAMHDIGHIRQIAELVRARKYLEGAGPLGREYRLNP